MTFWDCALECINNKELVRQYNRIFEANLGKSLNRKPIEKMVDKATGYDVHLENKEKVELHKFLMFVDEYIWSRIP